MPSVIAHQLSYVTGRSRHLVGRSLPATLPETCQVLAISESNPTTSRQLGRRKPSFRGKKSAGRKPGARNENGWKLVLLEPVDALALFGLERLHFEPQPLAERTGDETPYAVGLPTSLVHEVCQRSPLGPFEQADNIGFLAAVARRVGLLLRGGPFGR